SQTFEVQDIPAIAAVARARGIRVILDNTWSGGYFFDAFRAGWDVWLQAGPKYFGGHSDLMLATIPCSADVWRELADAFGALGQCAGPDDIYLALRGPRT